MRTATLQRGKSEDEGTFGKFVADSNWECYTGELPWRANAPGKSSIPAGTYVCIFANSPKHGMCYHVTGVDGRSDIEIHAANFVGDREKGLKCELLGCIALGMAIGVLSGQKALIHSLDAMHAFMDEMKGEKFMLTINDMP